MSADEVVHYGIETKRWLTVNQLRNVLSEIDPSAVVLPNSVGNLLVLTKDGTESLGYINFRDARFNLF